MKRDAIISLCIALPVANLPFWQWRSPAEMILMAGLFWQVDNSQAARAKTRIYFWGISPLTGLIRSIRDRTR